MPQIDEVLFYLRGLWLILFNPAEGARRLDLSPRGFIRSFWAIAYCAPPILLSWAAYRFDYLAGRPVGTTTGPDFFLKLGMVELLTWLVPLVAIGAVMVAAGFGDRLFDVLVTFNWLTVPITWMMSIYSLLSILSPDNSSSIVLVYLMLSMVMLAVQFLVFHGLLLGQKLLVSAILLTNIVTTIYVSWKLQVWLGLV